MNVLNDFSVYYFGIYHDLKYERNKIFKKTHKYKKDINNNRFMRFIATIFE